MNKDGTNRGRGLVPWLLFAGFLWMQAATGNYLWLIPTFVVACWLAWLAL